MILRFALLISAAFVAAPSALAQETGTLIRHRVAQMPGRGPAAARVTMEGFAACVVDRSQGRARKFIDLPVGSPEYKSLLKSMFDPSDECMADGHLKLSENLLRGGIFVALFQHDYKSKAIDAFPDDLNSGYLQLYGDTVPSSAYSVVALEQFGECVARANPALSRSLVLSYPASRQENEAVQVLMPKLSACIPDGEKIELSKATVKGAIAEGLLRLTRAATKSEFARTEVQK